MNHVRKTVTLISISDSKYPKNLRGFQFDEWSSIGPVEFDSVSLSLRSNPVILLYAATARHSVIKSSTRARHTTISDLSISTQLLKTHKQIQSVETSHQLVEHHERIRGYQSRVLLKSYFCLIKIEVSIAPFLIAKVLSFRTQGEFFLLTFSCGFEAEPKLWQTNWSENHDHKFNYQRYQVGDRLRCMRWLSRYNNCHPSSVSAPTAPRFEVNHLL